MSNEYLLIAVFAVLIARLIYIGFRTRAPRAVEADGRHGATEPAHTGHVLVRDELRSYGYVAEEDWRYLQDYVGSLFYHDWKLGDFYHAASVMRAIPSKRKWAAYDYMSKRRMDTSFSAPSRPGKPSLRNLDKFPREVGMLLTTASSGYVREEALKVWGPSMEKEEFAFIFARLNDWVQVVRKAAHRILEAKLATLSPSEAFELMPGLAKVARGGRHQSSSLIDRAIALVSKDKACSEALIKGNDRAAARVFFEQVWKTQALDQKTTLQAVTAAKDPVLRRSVFKLAVELPEAASEAAFELFAGDKDPSVRSARLRFAEQLDVQVFEETIETGLWDKHRGVRDLSQFYYRKRHGADALASVYRDFLQRPSEAQREVAVAINGCTEAGVTLEVDELERFLENGENASAMAVFSHSNVPPEWVWDCLIGRREYSLKVCRAAVECLVNFHSGCTADQLLSAYAASKSKEGKATMLGLVSKLSFWDRFYACLALWTLVPAERKNELQSVLKNWLCRTDVGAKPGSALYGKIKDQLARLEKLADEDLPLKSIEIALKGWRLE